MSAPPHEGVTIQLGGREWVVPPLSFGFMLKNFEKLQKLNTMPLLDMMSFQLEVAHAALSRNYPELTLEQVGELLDSGNCVRLWNAIRDVSKNAFVELATMSAAVGPGKH